jgi:hypothetical protein
MDLAAAGKVRYPVRRGTLAVDLTARVGAPAEMLSEGHALERPATGLPRYARRQAGESDWERGGERRDTRANWDLLFHRTDWTNCAEDVLRCGSCLTGGIGGVLTVSPVVIV